MPDIPRFDWPIRAEFMNRDRELERLEEWWAASEPMPVNLYGRRRSGKSWLFRRFAHDKPAILLVAHKVAPGAQLASFADKLEPVLGLRPDLPDVPTLLRVLYRAARDQRFLVVIDEFPWLLSGAESAADRELSAIQAVIEEERDGSRLKLILCGSIVAQMEALQAERSPLHGRLVPLQLQPMTYDAATLFMSHLPPLARFERFAIAGGMPRYLSALSTGTSLRHVVSRSVLDRNAPLWDEGRNVLEQELREPKVYFSILQALAGGDRVMNDVVQAVRSTPSSVSKYLSVLETLRIVERRLPLNEPTTSRNGHWHLRDPFFRFWFRFVFPYQDELESGLTASDLYDTEVAPALNHHVSPQFEEWARTWTRAQFGRIASKVGAWWGPSRHDLRRMGERSTEEIDIVGLGRNRVTIVGEVTWQNRALGPSIVRDLDELKIPALTQAGFKLAGDLRILLVAKGGYTAALHDAAAQDERITLVDVPAALS